METGYDLEGLGHVNPVVCGAQPMAWPIPIQNQQIPGKPPQDMRFRLSTDQDGFAAGAAGIRVRSGVHDDGGDGDFARAEALGVARQFGDGVAVPFDRGPQTFGPELGWIHLAVADIGDLQGP